MRAGRLRHRGVLQSKTETLGTAGGVTTTLTTEATVWCGIEPLSVKEFIAIDQTQNEAQVRIVLRYYTGLDETWRVVNDGLAYSIQSVINENSRDRMLTLLCSEGVREAADLPTEVGGYLLLEDGFQLLLEDGSGSLLLES